MNEDIYIVGAGAVGKTLAVFLKHKGKNVTIIRGSQDNQLSIFEEISILINGNIQISELIEVRTLSSYSQLNGLVILTNKSFGNSGLATKLARKAIDCPIVLLQNGLGVERAFLHFEFTSLYRCVLFVSCENVSESIVKYKSVAPSPIGVINGKRSSLESIVSLLGNEYMKFEADSDINVLVWKKAIANCVFNSICPLLEVDNGIFFRDSIAFQIAQSVIFECVTIANKLGVNINVSEVEEQLLMISKRSHGQFISTHQDIKNGRMTEIDSFNYEVVRLAAELGLPGQVTNTKILGELIMVKSKLNFRG
jgi:2-dehydropantoate 2-reductase